jgi:hypothetical protein
VYFRAKTLIINWAATLNMVHLELNLYGEPISSAALQHAGESCTVYAGDSMAIALSNRAAAERIVYVKNWSLQSDLPQRITVTARRVRRPSEP